MIINWPPCNGTRIFVDGRLTAGWDNWQVSGYTPGYPETKPRVGLSGDGGNVVLYAFRSYVILMPGHYDFGTPSYTYSSPIGVAWQDRKQWLSDWGDGIYLFNLRWVWAAANHGGPGAIPSIDDSSWQAPNTKEQSRLSRSGDENNHPRWTPHLFLIDSSGLWFAIRSIWDNYSATWKDPWLSF